MPLKPGGTASAFGGRTFPDMNAAAREGVDQGFADLPSDRQNAMLAAMLALPEISKLADVDKPDGWLSVLFALADAGRLGATVPPAVSETP